jgi:hypothetical protein
MSEENPTPEETPEEEPKEEMSVLTRTAYEVIQGGWGPGGNYTRKLLVDAGHNPYEVEEEVQRLRDEKAAAEK